jgi:hypothetical protein
VGVVDREVEGKLNWELGNKIVYLGAEGMGTWFQRQEID